MNALQRAGLTPASATALLGASALAALAAYNNARARAAERENPPVGHFVDVDGVGLHYIARGTGRPVVLLHGNGVTSLDFLLSGLFQRAAQTHRVIAFDRPGFGYSERPAGRIWSAVAQAHLVLRACELLNIERPIVLGHSWGASVALAMGLLAPERVDSLILVSGYYYPTSEYEAPLLMGPAIPVLGPVLRHTIAPPLVRMMWPKLARKIFSPQSVPDSFWAYPTELSVRPSQLQAEGAESGLMIPDAIAMQSEYAGLKTPVTIIVGEADEVINVQKQSARLHREITQSRYLPVRGVGHMVHYFAANRIVDAFRDADAKAPPRRAVGAGQMAPEPTVM
jgi:pimeloyl-ACP methyl ester carboxylesterase